MHAKWVEEIKGDMFDEVLARRSFAGAIVGGGSLCQGNTSLNVGRKGLGDPRTLLAQHVPKIAAELCARPAAKGLLIFEWLENVYSAPPAVRKYYSGLYALHLSSWTLRPSGMWAG